MELEINRDVSKYKTTIKGYTPRGIVCTFIIVSLAAAIAIGLYDYLLMWAQLLLIAVSCLPVAFFYLDEIPLYSLPAEKIIRIMLIYAFSPKKSKVENVDMFQKRKRDNPIVSILTKHKFNVPRSVQDFIPLDCFFEDGMARVGNRYSVIYRFSDVDFSMLSDSDKTAVLEKYEQVIASFSDKATYKISVISHNISREKVYRNMAMPEFSINQKLADSINELIYNDIAATGQTVTGLYLTVTVYQNSEADATTYFEVLSNELYSKFSEVGSLCYRVSLRDRLALYHFINNQHNNTMFAFNSINDIKAADIKQYCCPQQWHIHSDYIDMGNCLLRSFYLQTVGTSLNDKYFRAMLNAIPDLSVASIEMDCLSRNEAQIQINRAVADTNDKLSKYRQGKTKSGDVSAYAPPELVDEAKSANSLYNDVMNRDQKLFMATILVVITAPDKETLELNTKAFYSKAMENNCTFNILYHQQVQGLFSCLPYGIANPIEVRRLMSAESISAFIPLSEQVVRNYDAKALWEGRNPISKKVHSINRGNLLNGNGMIFGDSGSGKSVQAKLDIIQRRIKEQDADIIILDPKGEYYRLAADLGGTVVNISASSNTHINLMEISEGYGTGEELSASRAVKAKVSFLQSAIQTICAGEIPTTALNSIVDRCASRLYKRYLSNPSAPQPTLTDLYSELNNEKKDEEIARQIAVAIETYAVGSLDLFSHQTNIDTNNRFTVYDMHSLEDSFRDLGLMVMLDQVINRVARNRTLGRYTYVYIDEFHKFFGTPAEVMIMDLWKMGRAMHCFSTGITQNIIDVLNNTNGQLVAHNSEFLKILKCGRMEILEDLSRVVFIPQQLVTYISGAAVGEEKMRKSTGLIKYGTTIIPFESEIPHTSYLYQIINSD